MISVVMCTYNGERFLQQQLESIRAQSILPGEMVIADDVSADGTIGVLERFAANAPFRVTLIRNATRQNAARNFEQTALRASGDIIFFADQDDVWEPHKIRDMKAALEANPTAEMVVSDGQCIDLEGHPLRFTLFDCVGQWVIDTFADGRSSQFRVLLQRDVVCGAACCIRDRLLKTCTPFSPNWVHDAWMAFAAARRNGIVVLRAPLIKYRVHAAQQIGVRPQWKLDRSLLHKNDRQAQLQRFRDLQSFWWNSLSSEQRKALDEKIEHLLFRANLPVSISHRTAAIVHRLVRGDYHRYSLGLRSVLLDLLRPRVPGAGRNERRADPGNN